MFYLAEREACARRASSAGDVADNVGSHRLVFMFQPSCIIKPKTIKLQDSLQRSFRGRQSNHTFYSPLPASWGE